ncbi:NAD-dependent epimerase/dehydratase family protein [Acidicapsa dinghuensis]|uniref:NAD-dependent epimerase/dehydratase family protein n=1 Tax=Acidicapsa dinghuensis TaxID=2218256 RepID=A0ABW1EIA4_9BACT|nr:NAD-dependent epimerase/dehydratase family protein [Acidicapsa dinghuensis]
MRVIIFGATGMVGQAALRESLLAPDVEEVVTVSRSATLSNHPKHCALVATDLFDLSSLEGKLGGLDACFFCIGVTSAGMSEADYTQITHDLTLRVAHVLVRLNPAMTFVYVSGAGTDSSEHGRSMWARVKGRTENELLRMPFQAAYMFRPGFIVPLDGITSKTRSYRVFYAMLKPLMPILRWLFPGSVLTTREIGGAMLIAARQANEKRVMETGDMRIMLEKQHR